MNAREILEQAVREDVSDIFIVAGLPVSCRKNGNIIQTQEEKLFPKETEALLNEIYGMAGDRDMMNLLVHGDDDFSFAIPGVSRFRVSAYKQRGALSAVIRVITFQPFSRLVRSSSGMPGINSRSTDQFCSTSSVLLQ